jgi:hypothetical protein
MRMERLVIWLNKLALASPISWWFLSQQILLTKCGRLLTVCAPPYNRAR